ncbi:uncharacterized protein LOC115181726, partial [Salmo trutta]|uniref:uncharacterized protein LOC115181726 n=1 Tax=Salmo trutta TaxID=8032 RepID=UPI001131D83B
MGKGGITGISQFKGDDGGFSATLDKLKLKHVGSAGCELHNLEGDLLCWQRLDEVTTCTQTLRRPEKQTEGDLLCWQRLDEVTTCTQTLRRPEKQTEGDLLCWQRLDEVTTCTQTLRRLEKQTEGDLLCWQRLDEVTTCTQTLRRPEKQTEGDLLCWQRLDEVTTCTQTLRRPEKQTEGDLLCWQRLDEVTTCTQTLRRLEKQTEGDLLCCQRLDEVTTCTQTLRRPEKQTEGDLLCWQRLDEVTTCTQTLRRPEKQTEGDLLCWQRLDEVTTCTQTLRRPEKQTEEEGEGDGATKFVAHFLPAIPLDWVVAVGWLNLVTPSPPRHSFSSCGPWPNSLSKTTIQFCTAAAQLCVCVGGPWAAAMLSLDEPLDLMLPRGRVNGRDRGARSPSTLTLSPIPFKRARQLRMADDGTAVIVPVSPASPHTGVLVVSQERPETPPTPPAVDLSTSPSSRHTSSSPEMTNGNGVSHHIIAGVSRNHLTVRTLLNCPVPLCERRKRDASQL